MTLAWPWWQDNRDGEYYQLAMFATNERNEVVYVLTSLSGGLNLVSPAPGYTGCIVRQAFREEVEHLSGFEEITDYDGEDDES